MSIEDTRSPLARTIDHMRAGDTNLVRTSAAAQVTCGLHALANNKGPIPLELLDEWNGLMNKIRVSRDPIAVFHTDGMPD